MPDSDVKIEPFYVLTTNNENEDSGEETNTEKENKDEIFVEDLPAKKLSSPS